MSAAAINGTHQDDSSDQCVIIGDDFCGLDKSQFILNKFYQPYIYYVLIDEEQIKLRIKSLANSIHVEYSNSPLTLLCVLKGSFPFCSALYQELTRLRALDEIQYPIFLDFIRLKSYSDTKSAGDVQILDGYTVELGSKNVLIVEDIVDTGRSMGKLLEILCDSEQCIKIATLLLKRIPTCTIKPDFVGFDIPDRFVVGYGLDYNEYFRELEHICVLNELGIEKFKKAQQ